MSRTLYRHQPHPYQPKNPNATHQAEQHAAGFNTWLAVAITRLVGNMWTAYCFTLLSLIGLLGLLGWLNPFTFLLATWLSQQFLQLVFLPILSVGQGTLSRKQEIQADETYQTAMKIYHNDAQMTEHLKAQDAELVAQSATLQQLERDLIAINDRLSLIEEVHMEEVMKLLRTMQSDIAVLRHTAQQHRGFRLWPMKK